MSGIGEPLAPARCWVVFHLRVVGPAALWATVSTRRLWVVNLEMATFQIRGARGSAGVASLLIEPWSWNDTPYIEVSYGFAFRSTSTQIAS